MKTSDSPKKILDFKRYLGYLIYYAQYSFYQLKKIFKPDELLDKLMARIELAGEKPSLVEIKRPRDNRISAVDEYWSEHTVSMGEFRSAFMSRINLIWRFRWYPKFRELMGLYGDHNDEVILDYGCGPGNDLVGFGLYSKAKKIIGVDVSYKALKLAQQRLNLHPSIKPERIELVQISDRKAEIPVKKNSVDHIYSEGVLHHTTQPLAILREFFRILKPGSEARIMVYNYYSVFVHLWLAYERMIVKKDYPGLDIVKAFNKSTDGENCPISKYYKPQEFIALGEKAGFSCEYLGGYLSKTELDCLKKYFHEAIRDKRLSKEHKNFLKKLVFEKDGLIKYEGKYAGIGGVYRFLKK